MLKKIALLFVLGLTVTLSACQSTTVKPAAPVFSVEGAVAHAGEFTHGPDTTLLEAVQMAQPIDGVSDLAHVQLNRTIGGEAVSWVVDVEHMLATGDSTENVLLHAGDGILVPGGPIK